MQQTKSTTASDEIRDEIGQSKPLSKFIDWLTAAAMVFAGLLMATLGTGIYTLTDRERIANWVGAGRLTSAELTDAELINTTHALLTWGGIGTTITGLLVATGGVAFLIYRTRGRKTAEHSVAPDSTALAIVGGVVTIVTSFIPLSPILGGTVSGYLRGSDTSSGVRVGAYAGLVAAIPFALLSLPILGGLVAAAGQFGLSVFVGLTLVMSILVGVAYLVGLSAFGGYLGVKLAESQEPSLA
jgi:hypothetical protein